ncbi:polypeptide N-acetylgalactosaminyltransferase 2-like [Ostrea edulis]|uniref:polypeptide N-acetylgalactosaminyltransferase 2-like n=1 Tax=Ostrea edulis TaxID=37623 RepID=UPI0024AEB1B8|nr:polypeptide N-acetylgalactosaminyltransferase 2-like [Ostrea edulis]
MRKVRRLLFFLGISVVFTCGFYLLSGILYNVFDAGAGLHIITEVDNFGEIHTIPLRNFNPDTYLRSFPDEGNGKYRYNINRSFRIPWNRSLPDQRPQSCRYVMKTRNLPSASIIIVLQNESPSVVLRMVMSILRCSPPSLLQEIILVDDSGSKTDLYWKALSVIPKLYYYKQTDSKGSVEHLLWGADKADGDVLVLMSGVGEVIPGWLEPLLDRIHVKPAVIVSPVVDSINPETFGLESTETKQRAIFDWSLSVKWQQLSSKSNLAESIVTPVIDGTVVAVDRKSFIKLGKIDPGLEESANVGLELSLKSWMCGGTVEIIPCSHVGIIKKRKTDSAQNSNSLSLTRELRRVAEVWLDGYKRYFYAKRPSARMTSHGSVAERRKLRSQLKCQSFKWFLDNVFPQLKPLSYDDFVYGRIKQEPGMCMDIALGHVPVMASLSPCSEEKNSQEWTWKKKGIIKNYGMCLTADIKETHGYVLMQYCNNASSQIWFRQDNLIVHEASKQCIDSHKAEIGLVLSECEDFLNSQQWSLPNSDSV